MTATPTNTADVTASTHPLDPLTPSEIARSRSIIEEAGLLHDEVRFALVQLHEPPKATVLAWSEGDPIERRVRSVLLDTSTGEVKEVVTSLAESEVVSVTVVETETAPFGQPGIITSDLEVVNEVVRSDPRWQAAMRERGITDFAKCVVLPLAPGSFDRPDEAGRRLLRALTLFQEEPTDIPWLRPIEGVIAHVDLIERSVVAFFDYGSVPIPARQPDFSEGSWGPVRTTLKPLEITQPDGPSFSVDGSAVTWENWSFRVGFDARDGLVLHQISFDDGGRRRPIVYRASVGEMVVPFGDPDPMRFWISYFDEGEYGFGRLASSLALGCDCLGAIHYFDGIVADEHGEPETLSRVVCMHEEDYGVLWKHDDFFSGTSETRRSRRLVISSWTVIGNYDYGFFWYLYQDGTIEFEAKLSGMVFAVATGEAGAGAYASALEPGLSAPYHQHLFNVRMDMTVDGVANTLEEVDVVGIEDEDVNPYGNAFTTVVTTIESERDAARVADPARSRTWSIVNRDITNGAGEPVAYKLVTENSPLLLAQPGSSLARRAAFATKHVWATRYAQDERYAAGEYPNQHSGGAGLPEYQAADRSLVDEDIVLWHTFGTTHIPRAEDWPVMPVEYAGFTLKPFNFFDRNPALDLPKSSPGAECSVITETGGACH